MLNPRESRARGRVGGVIALLVMLGLAVTTGAAERQPLFEDAAPLTVTLALPLSTLLKNPGEGPFTGSVSLTADGAAVTLDVEVSARGHSRLEYCDMPPLKLNFRKEQVEGTVFAHQDKLKLVNQCKPDRKYARYLHQEYGIYRAYGALTDEAFRVRMLELTFVDTDGWMRNRTRPGFLIENDGRLAARLGAEELELPEVPVGTLDPDAVTRVGLYQYLVGNTDWSVKQGRSDGPCCHNGLLLELDEGRRTIVPYDFDQAGLIDAEYALPAKGLPIRKVRQRLFRGLCTGDDRLAAAVELFNDRRGDIEAAFPAEGSLRHGNKRAQKYIAEFFEVVNDSEATQEEILDRCRGTPDAWE